MRGTGTDNSSVSAFIWFLELVIHPLSAKPCPKSVYRALEAVPPVEAVWLAQCM